MEKKYLKVAYIALILLVSFFITGYYKSIYNIRSYENIFELNNGIHTLIIGDSHTMSSLDPDIIRNSKNISLDSENYFFTYYKLKQYLSHNSQIKNVILGFSTHNVSKMFSEMFFYNEPTEKQVLERYYPILDLEGKIRIMSLRKYFVISALKYEFGIPLEIYKDDFFLKKVFRRKIRESDYKFIGGFYRSEKSNVNIKDTHKKINLYYYDDHFTYPGKSDLDVEFLHKIIELCASKGIKVYLYSSPVFHLYKELIPEQTVRDFEHVKKEIIRSYENTTYVDHTDYIQEQAYFGDQDHVNSFGAKVVSQILYERILRDSN